MIHSWTFKCLLPLLFLYTVERNSTDQQEAGLMELPPAEYRSTCHIYDDRLANSLSYLRRIFSWFGFVQDFSLLENLYIKKYEKRTDPTSDIKQIYKMHFPLLTYHQVFLLGILVLLVLQYVS